MLIPTDCSNQCFKCYTQTGLGIIANAFFAEHWNKFGRKGLIFGCSMLDLVEEKSQLRKKIHTFMVKDGELLYVFDTSSQSKRYHLLKTIDLQDSLLDCRIEGPEIKITDYEFTMKWCIIDEAEFRVWSGYFS
ncbi:hypothetical protein ROZALSC1DRAFT_24474, partial [Rozella allomycis CSF55]